MMDHRPTGSNADEWHLFLSEHLDNRANFPNGLTYVAVQIAEAIDAAAPAVGGETLKERLEMFADHGAPTMAEAQEVISDALLEIKRLAAIIANATVRAGDGPEQPAAVPAMFRCNCPHEARSGCSEPRCAHYTPPREEGDMS